MRSFTTGLIAGGIAAVAGMGYILNDKKAQKKLMKNSKKLAYKAEDVMGNIADTIEKM